MKFALSCVALSITLLLAGCSSNSAMPEFNGEPTPLRCAAPTSQTLSSQTMNSPRPGATGWNAPRTTGRILVTSTGGLTAQNVKRLQNLNVRNVTPTLQQVQTPDGKTDEAFAQELAQAGWQVQPDFLYQPLSITDDPGFPGNAGISVSGTRLTQTYLNRTRVPDAWDVLRRRALPLSGALTAVLDTAVDITHPELQGRVTALVSQVGKLRTGDLRDCKHGTAAAGIIGATGNNGQGMTGTGQRQPLLLEEVMSAEGASTSDVASALYDAVRRGAKVINISLGIPENPGDQALDQALTTTANSAVLVAAAGNTNVDVYYPASHRLVIAVGAVGTSDSDLAWYSARPSAPERRALDIVAPGGTETAPVLTLAPGHGYVGLAGTSFAAPQVAGVAALMRAANPSLSAAQTRALLLSNVNSASGLPLLDAAAAVTGAITGK